MKTGYTRWFQLLVLAASLTLANRAQALYTNYLDGVSNALTAYYAVLTSDPSPSLSERQQIGLIGRALRTLSLSSTNVAGDYRLFVKAATQLGPIAADPTFLELGTNVFDAFTNRAQVEILETGERIAALNSFVTVRRAASNQVRQAQAALDRIPSLADIRVALLVGNLVYNKITVANRLAAIGEARPGFAAPSLAGTSLSHSNAQSAGTVTFTDGSNFTETEVGGEPNSGTYTYTRTGLNTATLVLTSDDGQGGESITTVKLTFTSSARGRFTARNVDSQGTESSSGSFTIP